MSAVTNVNPFPNVSHNLNPDFFRLPSYAQLIINVYKVSKENGRNMVKKINNLPLNRQLSNKFKIQDIFKVQWPEFREKYKERIKRSSIIKNVEAMIEYGSFSNGYQFYQISKKCIDAPHRHIVFTIPFVLRDYFQKDRNLLHDLFSAVENTFNYLISSKYSKKHEYKFGYTATLHTFGRALNFVPHLHVLIAEALCDKDGKIKRYRHFNYEQLRKCFQRALLTLFKERYGKKVQGLIYDLYNDYSDGFYVYGPQLDNSKVKSMKDVVQYIVRYAGHPAMSESRIDDVDYTNKLVTYHYDPYEDDNIEDEANKTGRLYVTESFDEFIAKLIVHFQMTISKLHDIMVSMPIKLKQTN